MKISHILFVAGLGALMLHVGPKAYKQAQHDLATISPATRGQ